MFFSGGSLKRGFGEFLKRGVEKKYCVDPLQWHSQLANSRVAEGGVVAVPRCRRAWPMSRCTLRAVFSAPTRRGPFFQQNICQRRLSSRYAECVRKNNFHTVIACINKRMACKFMHASIHQLARSYFYAYGEPHVCVCLCHVCVCVCVT